MGIGLGLEAAELRLDVWQYDVLLDREPDLAAGHVLVRDVREVARLLDLVRVRVRVRVRGRNPDPNPNPNPNFLLDLQSLCTLLLLGAGAW